MTVTFKWHGPAVERKIQANRDRALLAAGSAFKGQAKLIVPKKTHNLERSIDVSEIVNGVIRVFTNVFYAIYVEYGTRFMAPRSFFRKTIDITKNQLNSIFVKYMGQL
jgi:HK97 gp10 family phage protein